MAESSDANPPVSDNVDSNVASLSLNAAPPTSQTEPLLLSLEERFGLVRSVGEECIQEDELRNLLDKKPNPICYDGFEPSGRMHIAQGVMKIISVNKLTSAGCTVKIWIADWFAQLNNKMGGDLNKIRKIGEYLIEIWKAAGMKTERVEFLWSSNEINSRANEYWPLVMDIARKNTLQRIVRCGQIMGRTEQDELTAAQIFYPCMQCADIFFLKADICQLGMDQRKVNVLAREYCDDIKKKNKPIILSHHMLPGLQQGQEKMSKSDPSSSIFMEDEEAEVNVKIKKAYCPPKIVEANPCLEYIKYIIFPWFNKFEVIRQEENGGNKTYSCMEELISDYESGALHPADVKPALSKALNEILQPVRNHFKNNKKAKELLKQIKAYRVSRETVKVSIADLSDAKPLISDNVVSLFLGASSPTSQIEPSLLSLEERFAFVRSVGEECIQEDELRSLLDKKPNPICYDGFEPSGRMHIAQGVMKTINVNRLTSAGCTVKIWIADWFAQLNNKIGGDLNKICKVGDYLIEIWKAAGMKTERVEFLWSSNEINSRADEYWPLVMDIARKNTLQRIIRCGQIMGRTEQDELTAAQIFYPCMQCADIFFLKADICQLGMDQRKVNVLAREYCDDIKKKNKPIILSHHMLPGLQQGQEKMSKSDPSSSIFMEDEEAEVNVKIKKAYCPPKIVEANPCLEYIKYIIFPWFHKFEVIRQEENGGNKTYPCMEEVISDYESGALHPADVKPALSKALNEILQPVRNHFKNNKQARELLKQVKAYRVSR